MVPLTRRKCRSCDAEIYWVFTEHGNRMPIDADPRDDGNVALIQSPSGRRARVLPPEGMFEDEDLTELRQGVRYTSHFATCPNADEWRTQQGAHHP